MNRRPLIFDSALCREIFDWAEQRVARGADLTTGGWRAGMTHPLLPQAITAEGVGGAQALEYFREIIVPTVRANEDPMNFAFVATSPCSTSLAFEAAVAALNVFGGNWENAAGAIQAENQALAWLADRAGLPESAGGTFVAGGTIGNLSALVAARDWREKTLGRRPERWVLVCSEEAHSSISSAARVMDADLLQIPVDDCGRMRVELLSEYIVDPDAVFAIVGNAGATNCGAVDDFVALAEYVEKRGIWLHIDGAYGLGALASDRASGLFPGLERAQSLIVDPHKWLFAPYDCCALIYRHPEHGAEAHAQRAVYLDVIRQDHWNPSNYAIHLSRRLRGLSFWFGLATHGSDAYCDAINATLDTTSALAEAMRVSPELELMIPPSLSVVLFRKRGMSAEAMQAWSEEKLRTGEILCLPTIWRGETVLRLCLVNPRSQASEIMAALATL